MAYTRSIREISVDEDPIAAAIAAVAPGDDEVEADWGSATAHQLRLLELHPEAKLIVGSPSDVQSLSDSGGAEIGG